jgi:hypothetical protein
MNEFQFIVFDVICLIMIFCGAAGLMHLILPDVTKEEKELNIRVSLSFAFFVLALSLFYFTYNFPTFPA